MTDDSQLAHSQIHAASDDPTDARFTMRGLLLATTFVAVLAAIAGAILKRYAPDARPRLVSFWGIWLAVSIACTAYQFAQRKRAEQQAGQKILQLPMNDYAGPRWHTIVWVPLFLVSFFLTSSLVVDATSQANSTGWLFTLCFPVFLAMSMTAGMAPSLLWQHHVRFCKSGILWDRKVLPWESLIEYRWTGSAQERLDLFNVDATNDTPWVRVPNAAGRRIEIERVLDSMKEGSPSLPAETSRVGIGQVPISALFRTEAMRRHLGVIAISVLCGLWLTYLGWVRGADVREFDTALSIGFYLWCFVFASRLPLTGRKAGAPLARVFGRCDWLGFVVTFAAAIAVYLAATSFVCPIAWLLYVAGFAYCYLTLRTASYFFWTQLDLRAQGIVVSGAFYWPWATVKVLRWGPDSNGRLVLGRGWRRVVATVPPDQREAVDRVLREKRGGALATARRSISSK